MHAVWSLQILFPAGRVFFPSPCLSVWPLPTFSGRTCQDPSHAWACHGPSPPGACSCSRQLWAAGAAAARGPTLGFRGRSRAAGPQAGLHLKRPRCRGRRGGHPGAARPLPAVPHHARGRPPGQHPRASFLQRDGCERRDITRRRAPRCHVTPPGRGREVCAGWGEDPGSPGR